MNEGRRNLAGALRRLIREEGGVSGSRSPKGKKKGGSEAAVQAASRLLASIPAAVCKGEMRGCGTRGKRGPMEVRLAAIRHWSGPRWCLLDNPDVSPLFWQSRSTTGKKNVSSGILFICSWERGCRGGEYQHEPLRGDLGFIFDRNRWLFGLGGLTGDEEELGGCCLLRRHEMKNDEAVVIILKSIVIILYGFVCIVIYEIFECVLHL